MNRYYFSYLLIFYCLIFNHAQGQAKIQIWQPQQVRGNMIADYHQAIAKQSRLYNGPEYELNDIPSTNNAYFDTLGFTKGNVKYDGIVYNDVPLLFDEYDHLLITRLYDQHTLYALLTNSIAEFDLRGHHFIMLQPDDANKKMDAGFYDVIYNNKTQVLVKRVKVLKIDQGTITNHFEDDNDYYIKKGTSYYKVDSQNQILDVFNDKKPALKKYIKDNNIKFAKNNKDNAILSIAAYYDSITN